MSRNCVLEDRRSFSFPFKLFIFSLIFFLIAIHFANRVTCENENQFKSQVSCVENDSTLVYTFAEQPSINQVLSVEDSYLLVAATNSVYFFKDETYKKEIEKENRKQIKDYPKSFYINASIIGNKQFENTDLDSPMNELRILVPFDDQFLVCGTINDGMCYLLDAQVDHSSNSTKFKLDDDKLANGTKLNHLGHSEILCKLKGYFQDPLNCSRFYSCYRKGPSLYRSPIKDCPSGRGML